MPSGRFTSPILHAWRSALAKEGNDHRRGMRSSPERVEKQRLAAARFGRGERGRFVRKAGDDR